MPKIYIEVKAKPVLILRHLLRIADQSGHSFVALHSPAFQNQKIHTGLLLLQRRSFLSFLFSLHSFRFEGTSPPVTKLEWNSNENDHYLFLFKVSMCPPANPPPRESSVSGKSASRIRNSSPFFYFFIVSRPY